MVRKPTKNNRFRLAPEQWRAICAVEGIQMSEDKLAKARAAAREREFDKYDWAYANQPRYKMKGERKRDAVRDLAALPGRGSLLDVGCGRGDILDVAVTMGFGPLMGTEVVPSLLVPNRVEYGEVHALPFGDKSFDVVTMFDVMEHLLPGDDELACKELKRVARKHVLLTINNQPSFNKKGDNLHINIRKYRDWDVRLADWFGQDAVVTWLHGDRNYISEAWRIDL